MNMKDYHIKAAIAQMSFQILSLPNDSVQCRDLEHLIVDYKIALTTGKLWSDL